MWKQGSMPIVKEIIIIIFTYYIHNNAKTTINNYLFWHIVRVRTCETNWRHKMKKTKEPRKPQTITQPEANETTKEKNITS